MMRVCILLSYRCAAPGHHRVTHFVLFVLSGVREAWDNGGHATRWCDFASIDHNQQLHQVVVDFSTARLHDVHIFATHRLAYLHAERKRMQKCNAV